MNQVTAPAGRTCQRRAINSTPKMDARKIAFNKLMALVLVIMLCTSCKQKASPVSGTYRITSDDPVAKMLLAAENTYIKVNNDGTILYNTTLNQKPKFHILGTYTLDEKTNTLHVKWDSGKLPNKLTVQKVQANDVIRIGETVYVKERTTS